MIHNKIFGLFAALAVTLAVAPQSQASTIFSLNQDACTGTCGTGPFGTVTLTEFGSGASATVGVNVTLAANERFAGTGAGDALEFNVIGAVNITGITANFGIGPSPDTASAFGTFLHSVECTTCQGGNAGNPAGPLNFTVGSATGVTIASFIVNSGGYFFAADIVGNNGNTGNVGANGSTTVVPEPVSMGLVGSGLISIFFLRRRKNQLS
ncbi:MAG: PEP-CTERM sorting domain-containing protein [Acidobacteriota bacterium]